MPAKKKLKAAPTQETGLHTEANDTAAPASDHHALKPQLTEIRDQRAIAERQTHESHQSAAQTDQAKEAKSAARAKALPVLPWMRVPISIEGGSGVPLTRVTGLHPKALAAMQACKLFETFCFVTPSGSGGITESTHLQASGLHLTAVTSLQACWPSPAHCLNTTEVSRSHLLLQLCALCCSSAQLPASIQWKEHLGIVRVCKLATVRTIY